MSSASNEQIIRDLRGLVVRPVYSSSISAKPEIDKKSLLHKAKKVAENLDNAAAATAISH